MPTYRIECGRKGARGIRISYHDGEHYNSVRALGGGGGGGGDSQAEEDVEGGLQELRLSEPCTNEEGSEASEGDARQSGDISDGVGSMGDGGEPPPPMGPRARQQQQRNVKKAEKQARAAQRHREAVAAAAEGSGGKEEEPAANRVITL